MAGVAKHGLARGGIGADFVDAVGDYGAARVATAASVTSSLMRSAPQDTSVQTEPPEPTALPSAKTGQPAPQRRRRKHHCKHRRPRWKSQRRNTCYAKAGVGARCVGGVADDGEIRLTPARRSLSAKASKHAAQVPPWTTGQPPAQPSLPPPSLDMVCAASHCRPRGGVRTLYVSDVGDEMGNAPHGRCWHRHPNQNGQRRKTLPSTWRRLSMLRKRPPETVGQPPVRPVARHCRPRGGGGTRCHLCRHGQRRKTPLCMRSRRSTLCRCRRRRWGIPPHTVAGIAVLLEVALDLPAQVGAHVGGRRVNHTGKLREHRDEGGAEARPSARVSGPPRPKLSGADSGRKGRRRKQAPGARPRCPPPNRTPSPPRWLAGGSIPQRSGPPGRLSAWRTTCPRRRRRRRSRLDGEGRREHDGLADAAVDDDVADEVRRTSTLR